MSRRRIAVAALALGLALSTRPAAPARAAEQRSVLCTFRNPSYSGDCKQTATIPEEGTAQGVCKQILDCLNSVQCSQTYCNATQIRGGWALISSEEIKPAKK